MKTIISGLIFLFLLTQCGIDCTIEPMDTEELALLLQFQDLDEKHHASIAQEGEPGRQLWLCLTLIAKEDQSPLANQPVKLYHTSSEGEYQPSDPNDESTARLNGAAITTDQGQLFVKTILPGDYGSSRDNRHIHTTVENARPEAYDIHFEQYTGFMGKRFIRRRDQHFLAHLKQKKDGSLITFLTIEVKNPNSQ